MPYPQSIDKRRVKTHSTCILYSTKDRVELSERTFPPLAQSDGFDLIWMDGSKTEVGKSLPDKLAPSCPHLTAIHRGVTGGPDAAIVYGLSHALASGYEYIGLVENDVLLADGWFAALMQLFNIGVQDGFSVGATTVRPYDKRTLWQTNKYSVHFGSGAGMIMFSRAGAECVLRNYRTTTFGEVRAVFDQLHGKDITEFWEAAAWRQKGKNLKPTSADWYWDTALAREGMAVLGSVPGLARNIDPKPVKANVTEHVERSEGTIDGFQTWRQQLQNAKPSPEAAFQYDADLNLWLAYPHQIAALFKDAIKGDWEIAWDQTFGPFTLVSQSSDAKISLPVKGDVSVVLGPRNTWDRLREKVALPGRPLCLNKWPMFQLGSAPKTQMMTYQAPSAGTQVKALAFSEPQAWMKGDVAFRFEHIARFY